MNSTKQIILISVGFGSVLLLIVVFVICPLFQGIGVASDEFILTRKELSLSENELEKSEQFKDTYAKLETDLNKISQLFVNPEVPIDLIEFWEKLAGQSQLSIDIAPISLAAKKEDVWGSLGFRINLEGPFLDFLKFLQKTESCPYLSEVQNLSVKKLEVSANSVSANLVVKTFTK